MKFTVELDYYDMLTLWSYCTVEVKNLREIDPNSPVYPFLQQKADRLEKTADALNKSIDDNFKWYDHAQSWMEEV